jgi:hypothetical protein
MKILLLMITSTLLLGCGNKEGETVSSEAEIKADSLQSVADSLAELRRLHSLNTGQHIHAPGSNVAEAAHQDPVKKKRMRKSQIANRESREKAAADRARRVQSLIDSQSAQ